VTIRIYNPEKTLADGFKFRNKIGMDVVLEALKLNKSRKKFNLAKCSNMQKPAVWKRFYLEALL